MNRKNSAGAEGRRRGAQGKAASAAKGKLLGLLGWAMLALGTAAIALGIFWEPAPEEPRYEKRFANDDMLVTATYGEDARIPEEAELVAYMVTPESDPARYREKTREALTAAELEEGRVSNLAVCSVGFYLGGLEIEPAAPVTVTIQLMRDGFAVGAPLKVVHVTGEGAEVLTDIEAGEGGSATFTSDGFSDFIIFGVPVPAANDDSNLENYIKSMTLQKRDPATGNWMDVPENEAIVLGNNYKLKVYFEGGNDGFKSPMHWDLGKNVKCEPKSGAPIWNGSTQIGTYDLTEGGQVTVKFFDDFLKGTNQVLDMEFTMVPTDDSGDEDDMFPWSGRIKDHGVVKNTGKLEVQKSAGYYSTSSGSISYTVEATVTEGMVTDGKLEDKMGDGLTFREVESMAVYDSEGRDVTERYRSYIDELTKKAKEHEKKGETTWTLEPLPPLSEGMKFVVNYKGEVAEEHRKDKEYVAKNTVTFTGKKPDGNQADPDTATAEKNLAKDQITKSGDTIVIGEGDAAKEVIEWKVRIGSGQWDPLESELTVKDTLGDGLTFRKSEKIVVQRFDANDNPIGDPVEIDWDKVTLSEDGKEATYKLNKDMFKDYNWSEGGYLMVTYNTDFDREKQPETGFENTVKNDILAPEGVTGRLPVGEAVQKTVVDNEKEGYLTYTLVVDVPPSSHMKSMKGDKSDGHPELDLPYFYIEDRLDFGDDYFALNIPQDVTIHVEGKDRVYSQDFENVTYLSGDGDKVERETFQILQGPNSDDKIVGKNRRAFRIYFNTARYGLGTEGKLERHDSIWDLDFPTRVTITYKIPYGTTVVDQDGHDTGKTVGEVLNQGLKLENRALSRRSGVDLDDRCYLQKTPSTGELDKLARVLGEGVVEYRVSFVNRKTDADSRLITNKEKDREGRYYKTLDPTLTDTFDSRMEYVEGSLYVDVCSKDSGRVYATYEYKGENPVSGNTLTAHITGEWKQTWNDGDPKHYAEKTAIGDTFDEQRKYVFSYKLRLKDEFRKDWETETDIKNEAVFKFGGKELKDSTTVDIPSDMLQKSFEVTKSGTLKYTLKVNPLAADLVKVETGQGFVNLESYKLVDEMSENLHLVTAAGGDYSITVEYWDSDTSDYKPLERSGSSTGISKEALNYFCGTEGENGIYFILPDELHIRITYEVIVDGELNSQVIATNTATLYADSTETDRRDTVFEVGDSSATGSSDPVVRLEKTDAESGAQLEGAKFTLYGSATEATDVSGEPIVAEMDGKTVTLYPLKEYETDKFGAINKITADAGKDAIYALLETAAPEGYILEREPIFFRFPNYSGEYQQGTVTYGGKNYDIRDMEANGTIKVTNPPEGRAELRIVKVDELYEDRALEGAEFELRPVPDEGAEGEVIYSAVSGEDGVLLWTPTGGGETSDTLTLERGVYYLRETKAPEGYELLEAPIRVTVDSKGTVSCTLSGKPLSEGAAEGKIRVYRLPNSTGYTLPETGGSGGADIYALGGLALLTGVGCLFAAAQRRGRRGER